MSEWWTYSLSDFLLFSPHTYYRLFELYNLAVWPWHVLAIVLGLAVLVLWRRGGAWQGRTVAVILATCWLFVAWAYLLARYDTINWAARYFAAVAGAAGLCVFVFAVFAWPLVGRLLGRPWLQAEIFGIAPDPTVVATLGVLIAADRAHWELLVVPMLWCAISGATLWAMQSPDAWLAPAAALLALVLACWKTLSRPRQASPA